MRRALRLGAAAVFVAVFAGCNMIVGSTPSFVVPLPENDFGQFELWVYDEPGLLTGGRANQEAGQGIADSAVTARPDQSELEVTWVGGACSHRPSLSVSGNQDALRLELRPAPVEWSFVPVQCPAVGLLFAVTLTLVVPVAPHAVTLEEIR